MDLNSCKVIPVLKVSDFKLAKQFYIDHMGFEVEWEEHVVDKSYSYMVISFNHIIFHMTDCDKEKMSTGKIFIEYSEICEYIKFLSARKCTFEVIDLEMFPWKSIGIQIEDPFDHHLVFFEPEEV
ncbi:glyoxalase superfamily protein [Belliella marina]|uniref:Bleomycin resistance protein n=1 Tax=Belliella marina TaxID=1644146 RepID=A0ABW4VKZ0_9BACT